MFFPEFLSYNWILGYIPTWVPIAIICFGVFLAILEMTFEMLQLIPYGYRLPLRIITIVILAHGIYIKGRQDAIVHAEEELKKTVAEQKDVTNKVQQDFTRQLNDVRAKNEALKKTINTKDDTMCDLPKSFVELHDSAAKGTVPDTSKRIDGTSSGVALSTAEQTVVENYSLYNQIAEQLKALQYWVDEQRKLH